MAWLLLAVLEVEERMNNHHLLNITKTKEMVYNFRKKRHQLEAVLVQGTEVEQVSCHKYLGLQLDHKLNWSCLQKGPEQTVLFEKATFLRLTSVNQCCAHSLTLLWPVLCCFFWCGV